VSLAFGVLRPPGGEPRVCARVDGRTIDLSGLGDEFAEPTLNRVLALGAAEAVAAARDHDGRELDGEPLLPFAVADYVDFYSSLEHATNLGRLFRPEAEPLLPNWRWLPVGYHGRAGTVVPSGTPIRRPRGQRKAADAAEPSFGPSARLDIELEIGFVVGTASTLAEPVPVDEALDHLFGLVLVNDWSARDIQAWEYVPLGPFLGKSFATSLSTWVVPLTELEQRRVDLPPREPAPLPYLREPPWAYDLDLAVELNGTTVARTSSRHLYWSPAQQVAHLTANGASLRTGDLLASGTISGPTRESRGSLIELTWNGAEPLRLADGSTRTFLEDGDEVVLRAPAVDLEVRGTIVA
jgi:fumarylacetoacetase